MGTVGVQEMVLIFIVALVLFGPKKLPELGRTIGKAISEFRRASSDLKASFEREMHNLERETDALKETTQQQAIATAMPQASEHDYHNSYDSEYVYTPNDPTPSDTVPNHPVPTDLSTVSASEVPGAESHGTVETAVHEVHAAEAAPAVEGTVPRVEATPQHS